MPSTINTKVLLEIIENHVQQGLQALIVRDDLITDILVPEVSVKSNHMELSIKLVQGEYTVIFVAIYVNRVLMFSQTCDHKTKEDIDTFLVIPIYID